MLDAAENHRRENGRYQGELNHDLAAQEARYREDPALLITDMDAMWHRSGADWGYTCKCVYAPEPGASKHHLYSLRCTYAQAFLEEREEKIGLTWCCWDMGFTPAFHPLFCQYMPRHMLKGDSLCHQVRALAASPEEQAWLNSIEHTGWRSFLSGGPVEENAETGVTGQYIHRELFDSLTSAETYLANQQGFFDGLHIADGYYDLVQLLAGIVGDAVYPIAERVFSENELEYDGEALRTPFQVRRTDYNYMGYNAYNIALVDMTPELAPHVRRVYNNAAFQRGIDLINDESDQQLPGNVSVAINERGKVTGFICLDNRDVKALIFSDGRVHEPTRRALCEAGGGVRQKPVFINGS